MKGLLVKRKALLTIKIHDNHLTKLSLHGHFLKYFRKLYNLSGSNCRCYGTSADPLVDQSLTSRYGTSDVILKSSKK
jgi:hypothetical protein